MTTPIQQKWQEFQGVLTALCSHRWLRAEELIKQLEPSSPELLTDALRGCLVSMFSEPSQAQIHALIALVERGADADSLVEECMLWPSSAEHSIPALSQLREHQRRREHQAALDAAVVKPLPQGRGRL